MLVAAPVVMELADGSPTNSIGMSIIKIDYGSDLVLEKRLQVLEYKAGYI